DAGRGAHDHEDPRGDARLDDGAGLRAVRRCRHRRGRTRRCAHAGMPVAVRAGRHAGGDRPRDPGARARGPPAADQPFGTIAGVTPDEFRKQGYALVDWIAEYQQAVERHPVASKAAPGWVRSQLPAHPPTEPESFDAVLADLDRVILPGLTHWQHPSFF